MKSQLIIVFAGALLWQISALAAGGAPGRAAAGANEPAPVVWDSPSADARGSMPLGNGDITLNAWVDPSGDLLFYIGKSDAWEENARLAKVGLVRVRLQPSLLTAGTKFRQELSPARGEMTVTATPPSGSPVKLRLWVDANNPVVNVEVKSMAPIAATASFELWRKSRETLPSVECSDVENDARVGNKGRRPTIVEPDTVLHVDDGIGWYHHNARSNGPNETLEFQDLPMPGFRDPLLNRTFGALIRSPFARRVDDRTLESPPATRHLFSIYVVTRHPADPDRWLAAVREEASRAERTSLQAHRRAHLAWWRAFWNRSHVQIAPAASAADRNAPATVTRGYALQRYVTACAGRGAFPIKFNGSLFTVPWPGQPGDADFRRWGPGYWWQNTRLAYYPLCASGDFEMMQPLIRMYSGDMLALSLFRTKRYFGFEDAAYFPECVCFWGTVFPDTYGWETPAAERTDKLQTAGWHKREWVGGLEYAFLLLDYYAYTGDRAFVKSTLLPTAMPLLRFFDRYYRTGADGRLMMEPSQALETWWDCTNPMPEIAGLQAVTQRLLALPDGLLPTSDRRYLETLLRKIPPLPTREVDGCRLLAPAARYASKSNSENPELYAVFPFRLVSFEKPNASLGIEALHRRVDRGASGWRQDDLFMACLGLTDEARANVVERASHWDTACRFPAFWGPNYDWTPDQDHGNVLLAAVQTMLLQCEGDKIFVLPAWPSDWNVDFKLHAPSKTVVEGVFKEGRLLSLKVTPESRRADVVLPHSLTAP
jgi:hypothetical protein